MKGREVHAIMEAESDGAEEVAAASAGRGRPSPGAFRGASLTP